MRIREILTANVKTLDEDCTLAEAARLFQAEGISGAPVLNSAEEVVGVLSLSDLVHAAEICSSESSAPPGGYYWNAPEWVSLTPSLFSERFEHSPVSDCMSRILHVVEPESDMMDAVRIMCTNHLHRVLVLEGNKLVGIVSSLDILRTLL